MRVLKGCFKTAPWLRPAASPSSGVVPPRRIAPLIRSRRHSLVAGLSLGLGPTVPVLKQPFILAAVVLAAAGCQSASPVSRSGSSRPVDFRAVIEEAKAKVYPALVFVKPIRESFEGGEKAKQQVFGSGVVITPEGLVVTNNHVAEKSVQIRCVLFDKEQIPATVVGLDPETDLALLQLDRTRLKSPLPCAVFGDSDKLEEGEFVMALGSPFGFTRSISFGIISNTRRYMGFETQYKYNLWLQTDAAINPGNSGGPLVNTRGEVVGINTLGMGWGAEGLGFAIPSNVAKRVVEQLRKDGKVNRVWTGVEFQPLRDFARDTFFEAESGVIIAHVERNSPAEEAGLRENDLLLAVGGKPVVGMYVEDLPRLRTTLAELPLDKPVEFKVRRGTEDLACSVVPTLKGRFEGGDFDCKRWNFTVKEISKFKTPALYYFRKEGVYVQGVKYPGNAANAGLSVNDILLKVDGREVRSVADLQTVYSAALAAEAREKKVMIEVQRGGYKKLIVLDYNRDFKEDE
ncbi:MAG: trypsin-like peptidase domain-containing protein [Planctomycetota bacterium]